MGTWSVEPIDGAPATGVTKINNNGKFVFAQNPDDTERRYNIKYVSDNGCEATYPYSVSKCDIPTVCDCSTAGFSLHETSITLEYKAELQKTVEYDLTNSDCNVADIFAVQSKPNWLDVTINHEVKKIVFKTKSENTGSTVRSGYVYFKFSNQTCGTIDTQKMKVTQTYPEKKYFILKIKNVHPQMLCDCADEKCVPKIDRNGVYGTENGAGAIVYVQVSKKNQINNVIDESHKFISTADTWTIINPNYTFLENELEDYVLKITITPGQNNIIAESECKVQGCTDCLGYKNGKYCHLDWGQDYSGNFVNNQATIKYNNSYPTLKRIENYVISDNFSENPDEIPQGIEYINVFLDYGSNCPNCNQNN